MTPSGASKTALVVGRWPAWMNDSQRIVYVGLQYQLFVVALADTAIAQLTNLSQSSPGIHNNHPSVSPDGSLIAFASQDRNGPLNIWTVEADGSSPRQVTSEGTLDRFYWSPDSKSILYVSYRATDWSDENGSLWIVDVASKQRRLVIKGTKW